MGVLDLHIAIRYFVYPVLGIASYIFVIWFICAFLKFAKRSDEIRAQLTDRSPRPVNVRSVS